LGEERPAMSKYYTDDSLDKLCYRIAEKIHQAYEDSPTSYEVSSANRERDIAQNAKLIRNALADWKQGKNDRLSRFLVDRGLALPVLDKSDEWYSRIREEKSNETNQG
jgi:hypothetical protein